MSTKKPPRTSSATATNVRRGDETAARRLRAHGWLVLSPEQIAQLPPDVLTLSPIREQING